MTSYVLVVFYSQRFRDGEWDIDDALATWQVNIQDDDLERLQEALDARVEAGELDYHLEPTAAFGVSVDAVLEALEHPGRD